MFLPDNIILGARLSCIDWAEGGLEIAESVATSIALKKCGVDVIDCSSGGLVPQQKITLRPGYQVPFSKEIREKAGIVTAAVGLITDAKQADDIVQTGEADIVLLAREMLRDPYFPHHAAKILGAAPSVPPQYGTRLFMIQIRAATMDDIPALERAAYAMGTGPAKAGYFTRCLAERRVFLAESGGVVAGYVQFNAAPVYAGFRRFGIPEIQDLNVIPDFRGQGVGAALVAHCEGIARADGRTEIGISVGVHHGFGRGAAAVRQGRLRAGRGGGAYDDVSVARGDMKAVDDLLTLKMVKNLSA